MTRQTQFFQDVKQKKKIDVNTTFLKFLLSKECDVYAHFCLVYNS